MEEKCITDMSTKEVIEYVESRDKEEIFILVDEESKYVVIEKKKVIDMSVVDINYRIISYEEFMRELREYESGEDEDGKEI